MPRLVLYDDDGSTLFAGDVSRANVETVARFLRRHMTTIRVVADAKKKIGDVVEGVTNIADQVDELLDLFAPKPRRRALPRRKSR